MFSTYLDEFSSILRKTIATKSSSEIELDEAYTAVVGQMEEVRKKKSHVYLVGNGGSSAIVSHAAIDLLNACGFKAHALTDNSLLTCMANDYGYERIFSRQIEALGVQGDILVGISTSGNSKNVINAFEVAGNKEMITIGLFGKSGGMAKALVNQSIIVSSNSTARSQEMHILIGHILCDLIEEGLNLKK